MANEPIAVAFVEIRPDTTGFRNETDSQVQQQLGTNPTVVPAEFKLGGLEQANRDIQQLTRDVRTVQVPVEPDLSNFQADVSDAVSGVATPVVIPGQLQLEGLGEAQVEAEELAATLTDVASAPLGQGVDKLARELELARQEAELFSDAVVSTPTQGLGFLATGFGDVGDSATEATDGITDLSTGAGQAVSQLRYAVDVGEKFSTTNRAMALGAHHAAAGVKEQASGLGQAVATMRDGQRTVVNLGHGIFAQVQAFDALKDAQLGLVQVAPNVSRSTGAQISQVEALTAARIAEREAMEALVVVNKRAQIIGFPAGPGEIEATADVVQQQRASEAAAHTRLEAARAERIAQEQRSIGLQKVSEADAVVAVEEHARAEATGAAARADQLAIDTGTAKARVDQERVITDRQLVGAEAAVAESTLASGAAASTAAKEEGGLIRIRQRRAAPVGPFRLAGAGLGIGAAVFAGAQALGALSDVLKVTGDDASTFQGKMSNAASALLSFDVAGIFSALANNTHTYQVEQLRLINQTPQLVQVMKDLGQSANLARSATAAIAGLSQQPQFLQTALAREETQGDVGGQLKTLTRIRDDAIRRAEVVRQIGGTQAEVNAALEPILKDQKSAQDKINEILASGGASGAALSSRIDAATSAGDLSLVGDLLERQRGNLQDQINGVEGHRAELNAATGELKALTGRIDRTKKELNAATGGVIAAASQGPEGRGVGPVARDVQTSRPLDTLVQTLAEETKDLQDQRAKLEARIADLKAEGGNLKALKAQLEEANRAIEENTKALLDEEKRHLDEVLAQQSTADQTAQLEAEAFATPAVLIRSLQAEAIRIKGELIFLKALGPLAIDEYNAALARYIAINNQIESIQGGIAAENERHKTELQKSQDAAHQKLLDSIGVREQKLLNVRSRAEFSEALDNDIEAQQDLVRFYAAQSRNAKLTVEERRAFHNQFVSAQNELRQLNRDDRAAQHDQIRDAIAAREDLLRDRVTLAELNEKSTRDDAAALRRLIAFYAKQAHNRKLSRDERRDFLIKERQAEKELRDLSEKETGTAKDFSQQAFAFLQELHGFTSNLASNILPVGAKIGGGLFAPSTSSSTGPPSTFGVSSTTGKPSIIPKPLPGEGRQGPSGPSGPFDRGKTGAAAALALREQRGGTSTFGQMETLLHAVKGQTDVLRDIRRGLGHPEAKHTRAQARHPVETGVD